MHARPAAADAPRGSPRRDAGFSLLETLVALTVAAVLSIALVRFAAGVRQIGRQADQHMTVAALLARLTAALPAAADLSAFSRRGRQDGLDWRISAVPVPEEPGASPVAAAPATRDPAGSGDNADQAASQPPSWRLYRVTLEIRRGSDLLDVAETVRLGRAAAPDGGQP